MMPEMQVSIREAVESENNKLHTRIAELEAYKAEVEWHGQDIIDRLEAENKQLRYLCKARGIDVDHAFKLAAAKENGDDNLG